MLRRHHRFFQSIQILEDALMSGLAFAVAYGVRFAPFVAERFFPNQVPAPAQETLTVGLIVAAVWPAVGWFGGLYVSHRTKGLLAEAFEVFRTTLIALLGVVALTYFFREERYSRGTLLLWAALSFVLVTSLRLTVRILLRRVRARGKNLRHVLVVGLGDLSAQVIETMQRQPFLGMRVAGLVGHDSEEARVGGHIGAMPVVGVARDLPRLLAARPVDQVIVALPIDQLGALKGIMETLSQETVDVRLVPDVYQYATLCGSIEEFSGLPIINLQSSPLYGWNLVMKRAFDLSAAGLGLLVLSPLFLLLAMLVRATSPGPILFRQERVGLDGERFWMLKFRTMRTDAEPVGWTVENDPRRTAIGSFLRRYSLDELPQLLNVLRGDMSLVGPRPEQPRFIDEFKREIPRYALRHKIKAGMTGWAQVNGMRGNTSIKKRIELDLYYIENWSILLDLKIVLRTVFGGFFSHAEG